MPEDTGKPGESGRREENLARKAEQAGVNLSLETLKRLTRGDHEAMPGRFGDKRSPDDRAIERWQDGLGTDWKTPSVFFGPDGSGYTDYGPDRVPAAIHKNARLFKGRSSMDFAYKRGLMKQRRPEVEELTGKWTLEEVADHLGDYMELKGRTDTSNPDYAAFQEVAKRELENEGYDGAHWSYEDELSPEQYQIWNKDVIRFMPESAPDNRQRVKQHTIKVAMREIEQDMKDGTVPRTATSFGELQEYTDANLYVNDAEREDRRIGPLGKSLGWKPQDYADFTNEIIAEIDKRLSTRQRERQHSVQPGEPATPAERREAMQNPAPGKGDVRFMPEAPEKLTAVARKHATAKAFADSIQNAPAPRQNNEVNEPHRGEWKPGQLYKDDYGENPFIYEGQDIDPRMFGDLLKLEGEKYDTVVNMPTTQRYIEWYKQGEVPPPITVIKRAEGVENEGKLVNTDRRRVVAAIEAGVKTIPALVEIGRANELWSAATKSNPAPGEQRFMPEDDQRAYEKAGVEVLRDQDTGGKYRVAVKLDDGTVLIPTRKPFWSAHIDAAASLPSEILDRVVDGGFVKDGKWEPGGDLHQGLEKNENVHDYYGIPRDGAGFMPEDEPSIASLRDEFKRTSLISTGTAKRIMGDKPDYLDAVVDFMAKQRAKTVAGKLTKRDVAKAYLLTLSSIGAGGISPETFTAKTGMKVPSRYLSVEGGKQRIRPEEAAALWMGTKDGKTALDAIEAGNATPDMLESLLTMRDAFGRNDIRNNALRVGGRQRTLADIAEVTDEINAAKGNVEQIGKALTSLTGIAGGKIGFIKHLLGLGDTSTVDAVELNFWLTGKGSTRQQDGTRQELVRNLKERGLKNPSISKLVTDRIGQQVARLARQYDLDPEVASHIIHHWLWDTAKDATTTHKGMMEAQARYMPEDSGYIGAFNSSGNPVGKAVNRLNETNHEKLNLGNQNAPWRYNDRTKKVYWWDRPDSEEGAETLKDVEDFLKRKGKEVTGHEQIRSGWYTEIDSHGGKLPDLRFMPEESAPQPPERPARGAKLPDVMAYGRERRAWIDRFVAWSEKQPRNKPIVLADGDDRTGVITPAIGGGYRITRYLDIDGEQVPHGHQEFKTREEAVKDALAFDGFKSASDRRFMPESAPEAPRQRPDPRSAARLRIEQRGAGFANWTKGTKVVEIPEQHEFKTGEPVTVIGHHGSAVPITAFNVNKALGINDPQERGIYFLTTKKMPERYAKMASQMGRGKEPTVTSAYLRMKNPFVGPRISFKQLRAEGYDAWIGVPHKDLPEHGVEIAVFSGDQIKSSTDNSGAFDPKNPDIRFMPEAEDIERANRTARAAGAVGSKAITPRYVAETLKPGETVLNFGAGKPDASGKYGHSETIRAAGGLVTEHDFGRNAATAAKDALAKKYDTVFASNVLNVQSGIKMLTETLEQIKSSAKKRAVFNFPESPRYSDLTAEDVAAAIKNTFGSAPKKVGGTNRAPLWEVEITATAPRNAPNAKEAARRRMAARTQPQAQKRELAPAN